MRKTMGDFAATSLALALAATLPLSLQAETATSDGAKPQEETPVLAPVEVQADQQSTLINQDQVPKTSKIKASIQDTPASIIVVDKQFIQDTGAKNIQDALLYSAGVYSGNYGFDTRGDWKVVRGLDVSNYQDGMRSIFGYYNSARTDVYTLESIEVLKGPSSVLYGQSELGGIVNAVSKLPKEEQQGEVWAQVGSFDRTQLAADVTGPLSEDGRWLYRLVALERQSGTQVDYVDDDGYVVAPSLTWKPVDGTTMTLLMNRQEINGGVSAQFLPSKGTIDPAPRGQIPTNRFVGEPGWDRYDQDRTDITFFFDQRIADGWNFVSTIRSSESRAETREHWPAIPSVPTDNGDIDRVIYQVDRATDVNSADTRIEGNFNLGMTRHTLAVGADRVDAFWEQGNSIYGYGGTINLYDPDYGNLYADTLTPYDLADNKIEQLGVYIIDHIEIGNVVVSGALRKDNADTIQINTDGSRVVRKDQETSSRIGLMYRFDSGFSPYISYATSFVPNLGTGQGQGLLEPTTGEQQEVGFKYLSPAKDLSVAFAWFDIEQEERVVTGTSVDVVTQTGATVDGWEVEVKKTWNQFSLLANYSDIDAWDNDEDTRLAAVAEKLASAWAQYDAGNGIRAGAGARYTSDTVGALGGPTVPSVTLYDAMVGYTLGSWDFSVDGKNLNDKIYVSWCRYEGADCGYGERRNITGNVRYKF